MDRYDEEGKLTDSAHRSDHHFIKELKQKQAKKEEWITKVKISIMTSIIWSSISGVLVIVWYAIKTFIGGNK